MIFIDRSYTLAGTSYVIETATYDLIHWTDEADREGSRIKRIPEEDEKRRFIFWELLNLDCRMVS